MLLSWEGVVPQGDLSEIPVRCVRSRGGGEGEPLPQTPPLGGAPCLGLQYTHRSGNFIS